MLVVNNRQNTTSSELTAASQRVLALTTSKRVVSSRNSCISADGRGDRVCSSPDRGTIQSAEKNGRAVADVKTTSVLLERAQVITRTRYMVLVVRADA